MAMIIPDAEGVKVIIGTRTWIGSDWTHVDADSSSLRDNKGNSHPVDIVADAKKIKQIKSGTVDYVFSSECLEHFPWAEIEAVVSEWCRLLKPGGQIRIEVPDFKAACQQMLSSEGFELDWAMQQIFFGGQSSKFDFHCAGLTDNILKEFYDRSEVDVVNVEYGWECGWLRVDGVKRGA